MAGFRVFLVCSIHPAECMSSLIVRCIWARYGDTLYSSVEHNNFTLYIERVFTNDDDDDDGYSGHERP